MALRNCTNKSEAEKNEMLLRFLNAHEDQLFPQEVVALYLQCSPWTLAKMRCEEQALPFCKIGSRVAYKKKDVMAFLASKTITNTAQYQSI